MRLAIITAIYAVIVAVCIGLVWPLLRSGFDTPRQGKDGKYKNHPVKYLILIGMLVLFALPEIGAILPDGGANHFFQRWGNIFLGFAIYFFGPLFFIQAGRFIYKLVKKEKGPWSKPAARRIFFALLLTTVVVNAIGLYVAQDIKVTGYTIESDKVKEPFRLVLIADLHMGVNSHEWLYREMVADINAQDPDMVVVAGDIVTSSFSAVKDPLGYATILRDIDATYGTYVIYGNHDVDEPLLGGFTFDGENAQRNPGLAKFLIDANWHILSDDSDYIEEANMLVVGRRDESRPGDRIKERMDLKDLMESALSSDNVAPFVLLLQHEPADLPRLTDNNVDLSVSGHTHDGQIFPGNVFSRIKGPQSYGLKYWNGTPAVVTSGVGFYGPPIRVCTISEIVVIDIVPTME